jgi:hypothetical protein
MASAAQILANRENAAASSGPKTDAGKTKVSQNALRSGLFSTRNCVAPEDAETYEALRAGLWETFAPQNAAEEVFTAEIVRCSWRLQRCAATEESLLSLTDSKEIAATQASVDRARTQASGVLNRSIEQLRKLQTERWARRETLPKEFDASTVGIAACKQVIAAVSSDTHRLLASKRLNDIEIKERTLAEMFALPEGFTLPGWKTPGAKQTQSAPVPPATPAAVPPAACVTSVPGTKTQTMAI